MKKLFKIIALLSVFIFLVNCKPQMTSSEFDPISQDIDLPSNVRPPIDSGSDGDIIEDLQPLSEQEFYIGNIATFTNNIKLSTSFKGLFVPFEFVLNAPTKIDEEIFTNSRETIIAVNAKLIERAGGNLQYMRTELIIVTDQANNSFGLRFNENYKKALPQLGTYAKYQVDIYLKDRRKDANKKYLVTTRSFVFTVYGNNF